MIQHALISGLSAVKIFLLLMDVSNLEPNILLSQGSRRRVDDVFETIKTLIPLVLLFVYYSEPEVDFVCLLKIGLNVHNLRESLFSVVVAAIPVVQNADAIPQHRVLWISQVY